MISPKISTNVSKTRAFKVKWDGSDAAPASGIATYDVQRKIGKGGSWTNWKTNTPAASANFTGQAGKSYYFRTRARDKAGNAGAFSAAKRTIVPFDQSNVAILSSQTGFGGAISNSKTGYFLGTARFSMGAGDEVTYSFVGNFFALITDKGKGRGRADIYIDGKLKKTVDTFAASTRYRRAVYSISFKKIGKHTARIVNKGTPGRPRVTLDAAAVGR